MGRGWHLGHDPCLQFRRARRRDRRPCLLRAVPGLVDPRLGRRLQGRHRPRSSCSDGSRATVLRTGAVFRCRPDGSRMETFSIGYRNPYRDIAYDDKFNLFHSDNDQEDGSKFQGCRIMHVAEGTDGIVVVGTTGESPPVNFFP